MMTAALLVHPLFQCLDQLIPPCLDSIFHIKYPLALAVLLLFQLFGFRVGMALSGWG